MISVIFILISFIDFALSEEAFCNEGQQIQSYICLPKNYSKYDLPSKHVVVEAGFELTDFSEIDDMKLTVSMYMYLYFEWMEPRLEFKPDVDIPESTSVHIDALAHLWKPDVFIKNLIKFEKLEILGPLSGIDIWSNSKIGYYVTAKITIACAMLFNEFPFDKQICKLYLQSANYDIEDMVFESYHQYDPETNRQQDYNVNIYNLSESEDKFQEGNIVFSQVGFEIHLKRYLQPYLLSYYAPLCAMVMVSWISFVVPPDAIPGRVGLLVTTFLVVSTYFGSIQTMMPKSKGLTALSIYALTSLLFVFGAMQEFAALLYLMRRFKNKNRFANKVTPPNPCQKKRNGRGKCDTQKELEGFLDKIDSRSLHCFSILFIAFNISYIIFHSLQGHSDTHLE